MREYNDEYYKSLDKNDIEYILWIASKDGDKTDEELGIKRTKESRVVEYVGK